MALEFKIRDMLLPRKNILKEAGIKPRWFVVDFGCGPGSYILPLSKMVGENGMVYALDIHPLAVKMSKNIVEKRNLNNVCVEQIENNTIKTPDASVDMVLFYDLLHDMENPDAVLKELYRVLKPNGILSLSDHHLDEKDVLAKLQETGFFKFIQKGKKIYTFTKSVK